MNRIYDNYIFDYNKDKIFIRQIPEFINGEINPEFPLISDRDNFRINTLENLNQADNNIYTDDNGKIFTLYIVNQNNERITLFNFDTNDNLIVKESFTPPSSGNFSLELQNRIVPFLGRNNNKVFAFL